MSVREDHECVKMGTLVLQALGTLAYSLSSAHYQTLQDSCLAFLLPCHMCPGWPHMALLVAPGCCMVSWDLLPVRILTASRQVSTAAR